MKTPPRQTRTGTHAYATISMVASISLLIISMLAYTLIGSIRSFDSQARAQVKQDYSQKEDAILGALIHLVPNKAMGAMRQGSASNPTAYTWDTIFSEALSLANAQQAVNPQLLNSLNLGTAVSANTGDTQFSSVSQFVNAPAATYSGGSHRVNGGNWWEYIMLGNARVGPKIPAALQLPYNTYMLDKQYPIISFDKTYVNWYTKGLGLSADAYPLYNLIQYPDVKFGYKRPGEYFVAKRNWWVFSLTFGSHNQQRTGIPPVTKDYVLSIYEVPSQIPLSAAALMKVGKFADGTDWENVSLDGSIYADNLQTEGSVALTAGAISARKQVAVSGQTTVSGRTVTAGFDNLGAAEERAAAKTTGTTSNSSQSDFYDASVGGNVGKVAFIPINPGTDTFLNPGDGASSERISPTGWNAYSRAAPKAQMTLEVRAVSSVADQIPTEIRFRYRNSSNSIVTVTYTRGTNWPTEQESGGSAFPFQTDKLDNTRNALIIYMNRLPAFIAGLSSTGGITRNNSLYIHPVAGSSTVTIPSIPSLDTDMAVTLRGGNDLTAYTAGFSIISRYRVYIAESLNNVPTTIPANSGIPSGSLYYPPLSIFAPEKRFGESLTVNNSIELRGQLSSLKSGTAEAFNPLELLNGADERVSADSLNANLTSLRSPAELPPIHMMNWLVTIEEIH